jgi:hypothetical protein
MENFPNSVKAGVATAFFVFLAGVGTTLAGWLNDVASWATAHGDVPFPDPSLLRGALVSLAAAAGSGVLNTVVRWAQDRFGFGPTTPVYTPPGDPK